MARSQPPEDISPADFFIRWVPDAVAGDSERRRKLGATDATIEFDLSGEGGGIYTLRVESGRVSGQEGRSEKPDLVVRVDVPTWRALNRGDVAAPEALLRRKVKLEGDFLLGLKLHLILG